MSDYDELFIENSNDNKHISRKKRKVVNSKPKDKIGDGLIGPSPLAEKCNPINGSIDWECNSSKLQHIKMVIENEKIVFKCDCNYLETENRYCRHINAIVLKIYFDYMQQY